MASADELYAQTEAAKSKSEETSAPAAAVGDSAGEAISLVEAAKNSAADIGGALAVLNVETSAAQAHTIGERLETLVSRLNEVKDGAESMVAELAGIGTEFETVLSEIRALKGG